MQPSPQKSQPKSHPPKISLLLLAVLAGLMAVRTCCAGGGPENVFLLVNSLSQDSMTVANHYVQIRKIPASNVFYLEFDPKQWKVLGATFRDQILLPALEEIDRRGLSRQIDYLIYSCDFPWKVDFARDFPQQKFTVGYQPRGSITGSTYLWSFVKDRRKEMFGLSSNNYFSMPKNNATFSQGFSAQSRWLPGGQKTATKGLPYLLSTMLGVTYGRGNTVEEIVQGLQVASTADATHPRGTVYFLKHNGPRSTPRHSLYPKAVRELGLAGVKSEILDGQFPNGLQDIMGLTIGTTSFNIKDSGCRMLPGSIGDNLTSLGGIFKIGAGQTCISEFLRNGAAGACGTVVEPINYPQKFPSPFLHVHYAHGCSLAEAFYQSLYAPFQQLIVGDPLCQPWASPPEVRVLGFVRKTFVSGRLVLTPSVAKTKSRTIRSFELFVDGVLRKQCRWGQKFDLDTREMPDGYHELRIVATESGPVATQGRWIDSILVKNGRNAVQLSIENQSQLASDGYVKIRVSSTQKQAVAIMNNGRKLVEISSGNGQSKIPLDLLGHGPVVLRGVVEGEPGLVSRPLGFQVP